MHQRLLLLVVLAGLLMPQVAASQQDPMVGRWQVKFTFAGRREMNLIFDAQTKGTGTFLLLDTAADGKPETAARPAAWLPPDKNRVGFSGEVELPIGDCCREAGTLLFKGKFGPNDTLAGKIVFIATTEDEENGVGFRTMVGTFTATRLPPNK